MFLHFLRIFPSLFHSWLAEWLYTTLFKCTRVGSRSTWSPRPTPTKGHTPQTWKYCGLEMSPLLWSVYVQRRLPALSTMEACSSHGEDVLQTSSSEFLWTSPWGLMFLQEHRAMFQVKIATQTSLTYPNVDGMLSDSFRCTQDWFIPAISCCLCKGVETHTANFIHKLFWCVNNN